MKTLMLILCLTPMSVIINAQGFYGKGGVGFAFPLGTPSSIGYSLQGGVGFFQRWFFNQPITLEAEASIVMSNEIPKYYGVKAGRYCEILGIGFIPTIGLLRGRFNGDVDNTWKSDSALHYTIPVSLRVLFDRENGDHQSYIEFTWQQHLPQIMIVFLIGQNKIE